MADEAQVPETQAIERPEDQETGESGLRELSQDQLSAILDAHKLWVESEGKEGEQADLGKVNLQEAKLEGANLQEAKLGKANLEGANLQEADLQRANLEEANLRAAYIAKAKLQAATLRKANLQGAHLGESNLLRAKLGEADLQHAILREANLQQASLWKANLQETKLSEASLKGADLGEANLQKADLGKANLQKVNLGRANLQEAKLWRANLQEAYLEGANLQEADLGEADLQKAELGRANLQKANLFKANLRQADLMEANLEQANLIEAELQKADLAHAKRLSTATLRDANFEGATGLLGNEFAQADVTGATLPERIRDFPILQVIEETSRNARKIFIAMLLGCVYSWLTIATTGNPTTFTDSTLLKLPIIGTEIPIAWFYPVAPLVLLAAFFYLHFYLARLWEGLADLPAIFPDGKRLDQRAYPWLLNGLVRRHFEKLKERAFTSHLEEWFTIFLAWWAVPITLAGFWWLYLPRRDSTVTEIHIALIMTSVIAALQFLRLTRRILRRYERSPATNTWLQRKTWRTWLRMVAVTEIHIALIMTSVIAALQFLRLTRRILRRYERSPATNTWLQRKTWRTWLRMVADGVRRGFWEDADSQSETDSGRTRKVIKWLSARAILEIVLAVLLFIFLYWYSYGVISTSDEYFYTETAPASSSPRRTPICADARGRLESASEIIQRSEVFRKKVYPGFARRYLNRANAFPQIVASPDRTTSAQSAFLSSKKPSLG